MWLLTAFLAPIFYAGANVFDNFLANRKFRNPFALIFFTSFFNLIFLPLVFVVSRPELPPIATLPAFIGLGLVNVFYLYPYYRALQVEDTSVTISFFSLGRIFIPVLAYFVVGEVLAVSQYAGVFLIILSGVSLGLSKGGGRVRFSKAFWYIMVASLLIAIEGVLLKYIYEQGVGWSTAIGGEMIVSFLLSMGLAIHPGFRRDAVKQFSEFRRSIHIFGIEEAFTFIAFAAEAFAVKLAPVSLAKSISTFTPFFVLFYAFLLGRRFPGLFKEKIDGGSALKKIALFAMMILGVFLVAY